MVIMTHQTLSLSEVLVNFFFFLEGGGGGVGECPLRHQRDMSLWPMALKCKLYNLFIELTSIN